MSSVSSSKNKSEHNSYLDALGLVILTVVIFLVAQIIAIFLLVAILRLFGVDNVSQLFDDSVAIRFLAVALVGLMNVLLLYVVYKYQDWPFLKTIGLTIRPKPKVFGISFLVYIAYVATFIFLIPIINAIVPSLDVDQAQNLGFENTVGWQNLFVFFSLVITPAIVEELVFRGFLYPNLKKLISLKPAVIITSVVFGLLHLEFVGGDSLNWIAAIDTFILSLFLIYSLEKTKSIYAPIFIHALKNSVAFIFIFLL